MKNSKWHKGGIYLRLPLTVLIAGALSSSWAIAAGAPNVVIIVADDFGYADASFMNAPADRPPDINTPNIDSIAASGTMATRGYNTGNICANSRCGIMTGRYQNRLGFANNNVVSSVGLPLPSADYAGSNIKTLGQRFKEAGYATAMFGKWHLGESIDPQKIIDPGNGSINGPYQRGFDDTVFFDAGGASDYFFLPDRNLYLESVKAKISLAKIYKWDSATTYATAPLSADAPLVIKYPYLTDLWSKLGTDFINKQADANKKFFLYLAFNAVHEPLNVPNQPKILTGTDREKVTAMGLSMDLRIKELLDTLKARNLYNDTLIVFVSDNGGVVGVSDNRPLNMGKHYDHEGGIRTPLVYSWPNGGILAGAKINTPMITLDIAPTLLAAAGIEQTAKDSFDGVNILPALKGEGSVPTRWLYWSGGSDKANNAGDEAKSACQGPDNFKLLIQEDVMSVFDLNNDMHEDHDLIATPALIATNKAKWIDLYRHFVEWQDSCPNVVNEDGKFDEEKPRYKNYWSLFLPRVVSATPVVKGKGGYPIVSEEKLFATANTGTINFALTPRIASASNRVPLYPSAAIAPSAVTWDLIQTIDCTIDSAGKFKAGTQSGYVIVRGKCNFRDGTWITGKGGVLARIEEPSKIPPLGTYFIDPNNLSPADIAAFNALPPTDHYFYQLVEVIGGISSSTFDTWKATKFTAAEQADALISGDKADPDGDKVSNLMEFALLQEPKTADAGGLPKGVLSGGFMNLSYRQNKAATDLTYTVEVSSDLKVTWSVVPTANIVKVDKGAYYEVTATDPTPISGNAKRFMRLKVTKQ